MVSPVMEWSKNSNHQLENLPFAQQRQVLEFDRALSHTQSTGVPGAALLAFVGTIEPDDLLIMAQAMDGECRQRTA